MTARALAFSLFLAVPAAFLVLLGLFSLLADESAVRELVSRARTVVPAEAATLLDQSLTRAAHERGRGLVLTVAGLALALWTTTSAATTLMTGLTTTYDREDERGFVRRRLLALVIVAALALGSALVLGLLVLGPHVQRWVGHATGAETLVGWLWWTAQWPVLVLALLFAFALVLYLGPDVEQPSWALITPGAVTALVVWLAASGGLAVYASSFGSYEKTWGTLSAVIVTLLWLWVSSAALLLGAEVNAEARKLAESRRPAEARRPEARPLRRELGAPQAPARARRPPQGSGTQRP